MVDLFLLYTERSIFLFLGILMRMLEITDDLYKLEQIYDICLSLDQALHWVGKLICEIGWYPDILTCDYVTVVSKEENKSHTAA